MGEQADRGAAEMRPRTVTIERRIAAEGDVPDGPVRSDRRGFVRLAAVAAAGAAVATVADSSPAAAATGDPMLIGQTNNSTAPGGVTTTLDSPDPTNLMPIAFQVRNYSGFTRAPDIVHRVAIFGTSSDVDAGAGFRIGVFGDSSPLGDANKSGVGVYGSSNIVGFAAPAAPVGVFGIAVPDGAGNATAVLGQGEGAAIGVKGTSALGAGVVGTANSTGDGVTGQSTSGRGVLAKSTSGLDLDCNGTGRVRVKPQVAVGAPIAGTYAAGEMILDSAGDLFACVVAGTPGTWHRVGSTTTSPATGVFRPVDPFRAYDSRQAAYPVSGALTLGSNRVVSIKDAHASDGTLTLADVVPPGASAVTLNLTIVTPTASGGFLAVTPGDAATFVASSINWSTAGAVLANGGVAKIDANRQIRVFGGGAIGSVDFVVDITGYYV